MVIKEVEKVLWINQIRTVIIVIPEDMYMRLALNNMVCLTSTRSLTITISLEAGMLGIFWILL